MIYIYKPSLIFESCLIKSVFIRGTEDFLLFGGWLGGAYSI